METSVLHVDQGTLWLRLHGDDTVRVPDGLLHQSIRLLDVLETSTPTEDFPVEVGPAKLRLWIDQVGNIQHLDA